MASYQLRGKYAIVTGAGSGINLAFAQLLLEAGCSVMIADLKLRPEADELVRKYTTTSKDETAIAKFQQTDLSDWVQLSTLWEAALATFPQIDLVVNGAAIYEPPSSTFWNAPGISPLAQDQVDQKPGVYHIFAVNTMAPIRLAQIAVDYWLQNRHIKGNLLWVASLGGYAHSMQTPLYFASKAAIVSMVKSLGGMKKNFGIRNAAICPGPVDTPIFDAAYCRDRVRPGDFMMTAEQCAAVMLRVATEPQFGEGNLIEAMVVGTRDKPSVHVREVPVEVLYPTVGALGEDNHLMETEANFIKHVRDHGMREPYGPPSTKEQLG